MRKFIIFGFVLKYGSDMLLSVNIIKCLRTPFSIKSLIHKTSLKTSELQSKTIHLSIESRRHASSVPSARSRLPHGTSSKLFNAAWFPT